MKSNYEKYIQEIWDVKEKLYNKFKKGKEKSLLEFIRKEIKALPIKSTKNKIIQIYE